MSEDTTNPCSTTTAPQISLNALSSMPTPENFRLYCTIARHQVIILIDEGSTHNFIQTRLASFLHLPQVSTPVMRVMIGNDSTIDCDAKCTTIPIIIQGCTFNVDLFQLPIGNADIVLGVQLLKTLGPVTTEYSTLTMSFSLQDQLTSLRADVPILPCLASAQQLKRLAQTHSIAALYHITSLLDTTPPLTNYICVPSDTPSSTTLTQTELPLLNHLLLHYHTLFQEPTQLPPSRSITHRIHLLPNSNPVNVRPYHYPYSQKNELERQVIAMLQSDMIRPSHSPFSSSVLLVKKKDGSWRCCMDYRALNAITIKDYFPMPTIDELLDEIGTVSWFSKLDLRQGFHQIQMPEEDIPKTAFHTHHGHYEFKVMPFGLCNTPSLFQATMNPIFGPYLRQFIIVFFDDILVYSDMFTAHLHHLETTF